MGDVDDHSQSLKEDALDRLWEAVAHMPNPYKNGMPGRLPYMRASIDALHIITEHGGRPPAQRRALREKQS